MLSDDLLLIRGDARRLPLADESMQCIVTSPPYWGLRKYAGAQELVWGGVEGCEHEWADETKSAQRQRNGATGGIHKGRETNKLADNVVLNPATGATCQRCGAWRGAFGLEPTIEMYVAHTVEILRECRRVLRKDGVLWLNLGDSYASGGTNPIQSLSSKRAPACGSDDKEFLNWKESGCACSCHDDEPRGASLNHNAHNGLRLGRDASRLSRTVHDNEHLDSVSASQGGAARGVPASSTPASSQSSQENHAVQFCSNCLAVHRVDQLALLPSNSGTLYHLPKPKDLCLIPARVALAAQADGWWVRSMIIWAKPNPMPESCRDRPTDAYEDIIMFTKSARYFFDAFAVREPSVDPERERDDQFGGNKGAEVNHSPGSQSTGHASRNLKNVWTFATQPYSGAHFATFPEELPRRCILAATSERGACAQCGSPWERVTRKITGIPDSYNGSRFDKGKTRDAQDGLSATGEGERTADEETIGWRPTCLCYQASCPQCGIVLGYKWREEPRTKQRIQDGVRSMPEELSGAAQDEPVLQSGMPRPVDSEASTNNDRANGNDQRLRDALPSEPSGSQKRRLRDGAPDCDGEDSGPLFAERRSSPSFERVEGGQPRSEFTSDVEAGPRQDAEGEEDEDAAVPALREDDIPLGICRNCQRPLEFTGPEVVPQIVLDPFGGSGTTAKVAVELNRRAVSVDLAYHDLSKKRTREVQRTLALQSPS